MKYVYYDSSTDQVMAVFDTPNIADQTGWSSKGYLRAAVADGLDVDRDCKIVTVTSGVDGETITSVERSMNALQPYKPGRARKHQLQAKLSDDTITDGELRELLKLERGL